MTTASESVGVAFLLMWLESQFSVYLLFPSFLSTFAGMKTYFIVSKNEAAKNTATNHSGTPTSVHKVGISVNSNDNQDSESANSEQAALRDGLANQTSKPLLSDENKVLSENSTPQESSLLATSNLADSGAVSRSHQPSALPTSLITSGLLPGMQTHQRWFCVPDSSHSSRFGPLVWSLGLHVVLKKN